MSDFLGNNIVYLSYSECQSFVVELGISSCVQYEKWVKGELDDFPKKPDNIPNSPPTFYKQRMVELECFSQKKTKSHLREIMSTWKRQ